MPSRLRIKQLAAAAMLARGSSRGEISHHLKLRRTTLARWLRHPDFRQEMERHQQEMRQTTEKRVAALFDGSVAAIKSELSNGDCNHRRVQSALWVLKLLGMEQILPDNGQIVAETVQIMHDKGQIMSDNGQIMRNNAPEM